jgi:hypothetical protein
MGYEPTGGEEPPPPAPTQDNAVELFGGNQILILFPAKLTGMHTSPDSASHDI